MNERNERLNDGADQSVKRLPLACSISGPEQARRRGKLEEICEGCLRTVNLEDGYEFFFPGSEEWAFRLTEFIVVERACCPFFTFELVFEPGGGPIRLRVGGPAGTKDIVVEMFTIRTG